MSFDEIFDLTAGVYFQFLKYIVEIVKFTLRVDTDESTSGLKLGARFRYYFRDRQGAHPESGVLTGSSVVHPTVYQDTDQDREASHVRTR